LSNSIKRERLGCRLQIFALAQHGILSNQILDDGRACRRRAEAFFAHGFAQFVVPRPDLPAPSIALSSVASFEARRRFGLALLDLARGRVDLLVGLSPAQGSACLRIRHPCRNRQPARLHQNFARRLNGSLFDARDARCLEKLGGGIEIARNRFVTMS